MSELECVLVRVQAGNADARVQFQQEFGEALSLVVRRSLRCRTGASPLNRQIGRLAAALQTETELPGQSSATAAPPSRETDVATKECGRGVDRLIPRICALLIEKMTREVKQVPTGDETLRACGQEATVCR